MGAAWEMPVTAFSGGVAQEAGSETEHAASLIGQGRVLASPAAMAAVAATVAQGRPVVPRVVLDQEVPEPQSALTPQEAEDLRAMMRAVVTEGGASMLADNPGEPVMAKSGTAEFGSEDPPLTHVWMIAIQGDLAVAVFVAEGEFGSTTAGPLVDEFLTGAAG
jgi:cell division protein FtsI/penicillin-binding protein 2